MEMPQTHCHPTVRVSLLWKRRKLTVMQQALLHYHGNATGCIGHATKETQHVTIYWKKVFNSKQIYLKNQRFNST
jgi:hypothetical protein